jgi:hypothetical protein
MSFIPFQYTKYGLWNAKDIYAIDDTEKYEDSTVFTCLDKNCRDKNLERLLKGEEVKHDHQPLYFHDGYS